MLIAGHFSLPPSLSHFSLSSFSLSPLLLFFHSFFFPFLSFVLPSIPHFVLPSKNLSLSLSSLLIFCTLSYSFFRSLILLFLSSFLSFFPLPYMPLSLSPSLISWYLLHAFSHRLRSKCSSPLIVYRSQYFTIRFL